MMVEGFFLRVHAISLGKLSVKILISTDFLFRGHDDAGQLISSTVANWSNEGLSSAAE